MYIGVNLYIKCIGTTCQAVWYGDCYILVIRYYDFVEISALCSTYLALSRKWQTHSMKTCPVLRRYETFD